MKTYKLETTQGQKLGTVRLPEKPNKGDLIRTQDNQYSVDFVVLEHRYRFITLFVSPQRRL